MYRKCVLLLIVLLPVWVHAQTLRAEKGEKGILVSEGNDPVFFYQQETISRDGQYPRANYIHPLYGIDGFELTEDFPEDHLHQRGIFWAWHQVLIGDRRIGDPWECKDINWDVTLADTEYYSDGSLSLFFISYWGSPMWKLDGKEVPFMVEDTKVTVFPRRDNYRILDIDISLLALVPDLQIGGSEDEKGYGGFSVRMKMPDDITFNASGGEVVPKTLQIKAGPWVNISGNLRHGDGKAGIVIMSHPDNPGPSDKWILRKSGSMQNPVFPGRSPVSISDRGPTALKYRLVVFKDELSDEKIDELYRQQTD